MTKQPYTITSDGYLDFSEVKEESFDFGKYLCREADNVIAWSMIPKFINTLTNNLTPKENIKELSAQELVDSIDPRLYFRMDEQGEWLTIYKKEEELNGADLRLE